MVQGTLYSYINSQRYSALQLWFNLSKALSAGSSALVGLDMIARTEIAAANFHGNLTPLDDIQISRLDD